MQILEEQDGKFSRRSGRTSRSSRGNLQHCIVACQATNGNRARGRKQGPRGSQGEGIMGELEHSQVCAIIQLCWR